MKISGFSFVRNSDKLYYHIKEAIESILPIVDEFVVAVGKGDDDDTTRESIMSINSPKVKIIDTLWDEKYQIRGKNHSIQTNIAKNACSGDWLFYLQADEIVHEKDHEIIVNQCKKYLDNPEIEGLLFNYKHFWGDYDHYHDSHGWYPYEIRIIRNHKHIHSWESAQSFRYCEDLKDPHQREGTRKLKVAKAHADIYHYGWVRPPHYMVSKSKAFMQNHRGNERAEELFKNKPKEFDYGPLNKLAIFKGTHPKVMHEKIKQMDWKDKLQYSGKPDPNRQPHKHEKLKYRVVTILEKVLNGGDPIFGFKNYELVEKK